MKEDTQKNTLNDEEQQKSKLFLSQDQNVSEGLKQATKSDVTSVNASKVNETNTDRER